MSKHEQAALELHQQRAANLRAAMLLIELGAGIRVDEPVEQAARDAQPAKDGAA